MSRPLTVPLESIAACFEGVVPAEICSVSRDGTPNVTPLSIVQRVDDEHVALSFQFFNKTRRNILEHPRVQVLVVHPDTLHEYRLDLEYLRTETEGPLFESMRIRLDAVASEEGMESVFRLRGADVYRVIACEPAAHYGVETSADPPSSEAALLEAFGRRLGATRELGELVDEALQALADVFGYEHSLLFLPEADGLLRARGTHGYSGACSGRAVRPGEGAIGLAAQRGRTVRLTNARADRAYLHAVRERSARAGFARSVRTPLPAPGLRDLQSQLAVPLLAAGRLQGVLCLESHEAARFDEVDERLMSVAGQQLAWALASMASYAAPPLDEAEGSRGPAGKVRYYRLDDSVFVDDDYLIKGLAGQILWRMLRAHAREGRTDFTNKELRLQLTSPLSPAKDNLETRLLLLQRRLAERCPWIRLSRPGRGRLQLAVERPLDLQEIRG